MNECRNEGRKEGRKERRKEGRKERMKMNYYSFVLWAIIHHYTLIP